MTAPSLRVTALVPCHNAANFLGETLAALAAQSWSDLEILIGDDASGDATPEIIAAFAARHPQCRVIRQRRNLGWRQHLNLLMAEAGGEAMFFAFHDDLVAPDYAESLARALLADPAAILAFSDMTVEELDGSVSAERFTRFDRPGSAFSRGRIMAGFPPGWWVPNRGLFRAAAFRQLGGIPGHAAGQFSADWLWLLKLALHGPFVRVPRPLAFKRYRPGSVTKLSRFTPANIDALSAGGLAVIRASGLGPLAQLGLALAIATREEREALAHFGRVLRHRLRPG
jgi:glycosyltransferase involved in cell wall biosynthesis